MPWAAAAAVVGAGISAYSSNKAAKTQAESTNRAADLQAQAQAESNALQREMYQQQRADQEPWRQAGAAALGNLAANIGSGGQFGEKFNFQAEPGYQFRQGQGEEAINRAAAAGGRYNSGRAFKDLTTFNQGLASDEYQNAYNRYNTDITNRFNRLATLSGIGQTATNTLGQAGQNYAGNVGNALMTGAGNIGNALMGGANARASGYVGVGNAINSGIGQYLNYQQNQQMLNRFAPQQSAPATFSTIAPSATPAAPAGQYPWLS